MARIRAARRTRIMSAIRKRDTKPELVVRCYLHAQGIRYALHGAKLPGCPDLVFPSRRATVFVHGCFWHRCPHCVAGRKVVRSNVDYWHPKLERNVARDLRVRRDLESLGWQTFTIWECQTRDAHQLERLARKLFALPRIATGPRVYPTRLPPRQKPRPPEGARG
jgi:DNA mismatch endonuclease, patch repair protein